VAPSDDGITVGVWSTDQMGPTGQNATFVTDCPLGANNVNYLCHFSGTSAAAAFVSGVASLVIAKDQTLTSSEVYEILTQSAVTDLDSGTIAAPDEEYGYGRVDAFRAILSLARGDCNNDGQISLIDATTLVNHLFHTFDEMPPSDLLGDVNCDGLVNLTDVLKLNAHLFTTFEPLDVPCFEFGD